MLRSGMHARFSDESRRV